MIEVARALKIFMEPNFLGIPKGKGFCLVTQLQKKKKKVYMEDKKKRE